MVLDYRDAPAHSRSTKDEDAASRAAAEDILSDCREMLRTAESSAEDDDP